MAKVGGLDWLLGKLSSLKELLSIGTSGPGKVFKIFKSVDVTLRDIVQ